MPSGIIIRGIGGFYYVKIGKTVYECKARGVFRKNGIIPLPGDRVNITITDDKKNIGWIEKILPRESELIRPAVANVNQIAVVIAVKSPEPDLLLLDKLLVTAEKKAMNAIICVNKIDLDPQKNYMSIVEAYRCSGYRTVLLSSKLDIGYDELLENLKDRITVFAGQSGVGKSTILNRLMNANIMLTGEVSEKISRGKHTTRHAEIVEMNTGGFIVDTPGFSSFELSDIDAEDVHKYFPEFALYESKCRFSECMHISEPDCGVKGALESGMIDKGRYARYIELYSTLKQNNKFKSRK